MPSPPHFATGNWGFDALYPGKPPDGLEVQWVDDNEFYDPDAQLYFTLATDHRGEEMRIYSKRTMAEIDSKWGSVIARDRHRVIIAKRSISQENAGLTDKQIRETRSHVKSLNYEPATEKYLEQFDLKTLGSSEAEQLVYDDPHRANKQGTRRFSSSEEAAFVHRDGPPSPSERLEGWHQGGIRFMPDSKVRSSNSNGLMQNPQTGEWHELADGIVNPESEEQKERRVAEIREAKKIKASPGQMIRGAADTAGKAIMGGYTSTQVATARYQACLSCEHFMRKQSRCSLCGCFMRAKVKVALAECPASPSRWAK